MSNNFELLRFFVHNGIFDDTIQLMLGWWNPKGVWVAQKNISPHFHTIFFPPTGYLWKLSLWYHNSWIINRLFDLVYTFFIHIYIYIYCLRNLTLTWCSNPNLTLDWEPILIWGLHTWGCRFFPWCACSRGFSSQRISAESPPAYTRGNFKKRVLFNGIHLPRSITSLHRGLHKT